jgi:hypothetical protein
MQRVPVVAQFKYGDSWQHEYVIGMRLQWGGNDIGMPGRKHVVVDVVAEGPCPCCGYDAEWGIVIHIKDDVIDSMQTSHGEHDFVRGGATYLVLEE